MSQEEFDFDAPPRPKAEPMKEASKAMIDRVRKLLKLAADKRGNAHEAERAMQLAFELAEKHRIDLESVDLDEESARLVHEYWQIGARVNRARRLTIGILETYFHVTACYERRLQGCRVLIIGTPGDVLIARYVHDFLLRAARDCQSAWEKRERAARRRLSTNKRANYLAGFFYGISSALRGARETIPLTDSQAALVVAEEASRKQHLTDLVGETTTMKKLKSRRHEGALTAGYRDGRNTKINQPLNGAPGGPLALTQ